MFEAGESAWHQKGTWKQMKTALGMAATFTCPQCGLTGMLDPPDFKISPDGTVEPSVDCPEQKDSVNCPFHDRIRLIGWEADRVHDYRALKMRKGSRPLRGHG